MVPKEGKCTSMKKKDYPTKKEYKWLPARVLGRKYGRFL
jgi:hypothetical protein